MICSVEGGRAGSGTRSPDWMLCTAHVAALVLEQPREGSDCEISQGRRDILVSSHMAQHIAVCSSNCRNWDTQCRTDPGWGGPNSLSERHPDVTLLSTVICVMTNFSALDHAADNKKRHKPICQSQQFWGSCHLVHPVSSAEFLPCSVHTRFRRLYYTDLICVLSPSRAMGSFGTGFLTQLQLHYLGHCLASSVAGTKWWPKVSGRKAPCGPIRNIS